MDPVALSSISRAAPVAQLLPAVRQPVADTPSPQDVQRAAKQFEAILVRQLLAPAIEPMMSQSLGGSGGAGGGVYAYMLTDVLANSISQGGGLGFSSVVQSQLTSRAGTPASDQHE